MLTSLPLNIEQNMMDKVWSTEVPYILNNIHTGDVYEIDIKNIYDPSKLWIILKVKELNLFSKYINMFYSQDENRIKIPFFKLKKHLVCIIKINSKFYRSAILPLALPDLDKIRVFLMDFGSFVNVNIENVFYIFQKHRMVPRFALRACMLDIAPQNSIRWSKRENEHFLETLSDKKLYAFIKGINEENKIVYIDIFIKNQPEENCLESVAFQMLEKNLALPASVNFIKTENNPKYISTVKYPHLYPTIEAIEEGKVPSSLWEFNIVYTNVPLDLLLYPYYQYKNIN